MQNLQARAIDCGHADHLMDDNLTIHSDFESSCTHLLTKLQGQHQTGVFCFIIGHREQNLISHGDNSHSTITNNDPGAGYAINHEMASPL
jgi:hypothetical protein